MCRVNLRRQTGDPLHGRSPTALTGSEPSQLKSGCELGAHVRQMPADFLTPGSEQFRSGNWVLTVAQDYDTAWAVGYQALAFIESGNVLNSLADNGSVVDLNLVRSLGWRGLGSRLASRSHDVGQVSSDANQCSLLPRTGVVANSGSEHAVVPNSGCCELAYLCTVLRPVKGAATVNPALSFTSWALGALAVTISYRCLRKFAMAGHRRAAAGGRDGAAKGLGPGGICRWAPRRDRRSGPLA
jgi:hypothetical protein